MTTQRLATLRAIRLFRGQITREELANNLRISEVAARDRLEGMGRLVRKEGLGKEASYVMTKAGWARLKYIEEHLEGTDADS